MYEDELLTVLEKVNVGTGKLNPRVIKAWFDTDCDNLLQWICTSITEECYISPQENSEYSQLNNVLTHDQLNKKIKIIDIEYPEMFQLETNLFNIEFAKDAIEILEEQLKDCDHQLLVNQQLNQSLLAEISKISANEIQSQLEEEFARENCMKLSQELDKLNSQTYDQIIKYSSYLSNYEIADFPEFANNMDISEFEEKFADITNNLNSVTKIENDLLEMSTVKFVTDTLSELESRMFHARISQLAVQMEVEALNSTLKFFKSYDINTLISFIDHDSLALSVEVCKEQQTCMLKVIEETSLKLVQHYVNQPSVRCLENELNFFQLKLTYLNKFRDGLTKILLHFIIMHGLYLQEKIDINSSSQFFRNIKKYVSKDLHDSNFRKEAMLKLICQYEDFCLVPIENQFKLIGDFGTILFKGENMSITGILEEATVLRRNVEKLKKQQFCRVMNDRNMFKALHSNVQILEEFLISGPTCRIMTIPLSLQILLFEVNFNLLTQNSSVKSLIHAAQIPKDQLTRDKWLRHRNHLWMFFMMDGTKMLSFLDELKSDVNHGKGNKI